MKLKKIIAEHQRSAFVIYIQPDDVFDEPMNSFRFIFFIAAERNAQANQMTRDSSLCLYSLYVQ